MNLTYHKMQTHLKNLIKTITTGSPAEIKLAQKQVEKFWHNYFIPHRKEGKLAFLVFLEELNKIFHVISSAWNYWPHKKLNGLSPAEKLLEY